MELRRSMRLSKLKYNFDRANDLIHKNFYYKVGCPFLPGWIGVTEAAILMLMCPKASGKEMAAATAGAELRKLHQAS